MRIFSDTKTKTKTLVALVTLVSLVFTLIPGVSAQTVDTLKDQQSQLQQRLNQIQQKISSYQKQITDTQKQANTLKNQVSIFNNQITSLELQIEANQTQSEDVRLQIKETEEQIARRQAEINDNKKILSQLIIELNEMDSTSLLYLGLGNDNFSAFLDQVQYTESVQNKVYQILQNIKAVKAKLEAQQAELKVKLEDLEELREQLDQTESSLSRERSLKQNLLDQTRGVEKNYQKLLSQSKNEEDKIEQEIQDLDNAIRAKLGNRTIAATKGDLAWPMTGIFTQGYGNTGFTALGYNFHNGIDIAAPPGTPIYAAASGTVTSCDTGEAAYGNWCAIKHNIDTKNGKRCIVTLYAHMRSFKVKAGQQVSQGDLVGYEGNTGNTTRLLYGKERGYHLHFTVFDCEGFGISQGTYSKTYGRYTVPYGYTYNPMNFLGSR